MANTPNMDLNLPVVGETLGPEWAEDVNVAFESVDEHDHTDGKGVAIPVAALNINANLPINGFAITEANAVTFQAVVGTPSDLSVYSSGGELYYRDVNGTPVQITNNGSVDAGVGNIAGLGPYETLPGPVTHTASAAFSDLGLDFSFFYDTGLPSAINVGDIRLFPYDGEFTANTNAITLKSPAALSSNYALTLPTVLPSALSFARISTGGQISYFNPLTDQLSIGVPILAASGSPSLPAYSFTGTADSGMYSPADNVLAFSTDGSKRFEINTGAINSSLSIRGPLGSVSTPTFSFENDTNTGIYGNGSDALIFTTGGVSRLSIGTSSVTSSVGFNGTFGAFSGNVSAADMAATSINLSSGGGFKVKLITLPSSSSTDGNVSTAHGLSASEIRGLQCTIRDTSTGSIFGPGYSPDTSTAGVWVTGDSTDVRVQWSNLGTNVKFIYVTVTYI